MAEDIGETIRKCEQQRENLLRQAYVKEGEINALKLVKQILEAGGGEVPASGAPKAAPTVVQLDAGRKAVADYKAEIDKRKEEGICTHKDKMANGGKWCDKKLRGKAQKEAGFCKEHLEWMNG
jgi:hypothetical protein